MQRCINVYGIYEDRKVSSKSIQFDIDIKDYVEIAEKVMGNNSFQRKLVSKKGSVYNLLKQDIIGGCLMPPIVLASTLPLDGKEEINSEYIRNLLNNTRELKILDGLQRTNSIIDVYKSNIEHFNNLSYSYLIRCEVYVSINDTGILYRMLTLNTGQTPMTLRHQLEILYSNYLDKKIFEIDIIKDIDDRAVKEINQYKFSDLIEGFNSFLEKTEFPIDRVDILETIKTLDFISIKSKEFSFLDFVSVYYSFVKILDARYPHWIYPSEKDDIPEEYRFIGNPFGSNICKIFNKSQPLTGFGAAIGSLMESDQIKNITDLEEIMKRIVFLDQDLMLLNKSLDLIKEKSRKIGNGQRMFFRFLFKSLFDKESFYYMNFYDSINRAKSRTISDLD